MSAVFGSLTNWLIWTPLALLACAMTLVWIRARVRFVRALDGVPGPRALPLLGNALQLAVPLEDFFKLMGEYAATYGPMFRLWVGTRPFIFLYTAEGVQPVLSSAVHIDKSPDYRFLEPWIGTGLIISNGDKWRNRRKLLTPSFHSRVLDDFLEPLFRQANILVEKLAKHVNGAPFDIVPYTKLAALDIICETVMGKHVGAQMNSNSAYVIAIEKISSILQRRFITPWLKPDFLFNLSSFGRAQRKCLDVIHGFTNSVYQDRKKEAKMRWESNQASRGVAARPAPQEQKTRGRLALLDLLLDMKFKGANLSDEDIREEVDTFTFAGHDTTSHAIAWCLYLLGKHPVIQESIVKELRAAKIAANGSRLGVRDLGLGRLDLLERCIKESLRLYPVVPVIARDIKSPVEVLGVNIPAGSTVLINTYLLHRDPRFFPEPDKFDPDRFLMGCDSVRHPFAYVPFSAGSRNCIGQRFAMMELKVLLGCILERFQVCSVDSEECLRPVGELVLRNLDGIRLVITHRTGT